jgi:hypothetical protein
MTKRQQEEKGKTLVKVLILIIFALLVLSLVLLSVMG